MESENGEPGTSGGEAGMFGREGGASGRRGGASGPEHGSGEAERTVLAEDRRWMVDLWAAVFCALSLLVLLHTVDLAAATLTAVRSALWTGLSLTLFAVLFPPRVSVGRDWLSVRGLLGERRVSTDLLTQVARRDGIAQRIVLKDARGRRVEVDPLTLAANPLLWHELDTGARRARERGYLRTGSAILQSLSDRIESDTARGVFEASDLR
ncbi:hypothetical protein ACWF94_15730 [Streptomyces sp. NPDC055078]